MISSSHVENNASRERWVIQPMAYMSDITSVCRVWEGHKTQKHLRKKKKVDSFEYFHFLLHRMCHIPPQVNMCHLALPSPDTHTLYLDIRTTLLIL